VADLLWAGASDYLRRPFDVRELLVRSKAILRRVAALARGGATAVRAPGLRLGFEPPRANPLLQ
jgi:DNA-binding response OmpR family regulator